MALVMTTKLAWRATVAVLICVIISLFSQSQYSFWATFIAFVLIAPSIGEGVFLTTARILTTVVGCLIASLLFLTWPAPLWLKVASGLIGLFFFVAYTRIRIWTSMLALGFTIGAFFSVVKVWSWHLYQLRILETMLGGSVAVIINCTMWPVLAKRQMCITRADIQRMFLELYKTMQKAEFETNLTSLRQQNFLISQQAALFQKLINFARYEIFFKSRYVGSPQKDLDHYTEFFEATGHLLDSLELVQRQPYFQNLYPLIQTSVDAVAQALEKHQVDEAAIVEMWSQRFQSTLQVYSLDELQVFVQLYYYFRRVVELASK